MSNPFFYAINVRNIPQPLNPKVSNLYLVGHQISLNKHFVIPTF